MMRPWICGKSLSNVSPIDDSLMENPGRVAFVESLIMSSTPLALISAMRWKSVVVPSTGVWSNLKSPVWKMTPSGV